MLIILLSRGHCGFDVARDGAFNLLLPYDLIGHESHWRCANAKKGQMELLLKLLTILSIIFFQYQFFSLAVHVQSLKLIYRE